MTSSMVRDEMTSSMVRDDLKYGKRWPSMVKDDLENGNSKSMVRGKKCSSHMISDDLI